MQQKPVPPFPVTAFLCSLLPATLLLCLLSSCAHTRQLQANQPDSLPPLPESTISIPVKIVARPFLDQAETLTPLEFTSTQWPEYTPYGCDFRYKYRFVRSRMKFSCVNNQISIAVTGNYQVAGSKSVCVMGRQVAPWITGGCGFNNEPLRRVDITIRSVVRFVPNYTIRSRSGIDSIHPVDRCSVTFLNTDVTGMVMNTVRSSMNEFTASLDRDLAKLTLSPVIRKVETGIARQIALSHYGFLAVNPSSLKMGAINYSSDTIFVQAGFSCYPRLTSDSSARVQRVSLPPLSSGESPEGFSLYANASYDYAFIGQMLSRAVHGRNFTIRGEQVSIDEITVRPLEGRRVEIKAVFSGSRQGVLYLTGTPVLDAARQTVSVPDLDFSLRSRSFVLNAGKAFFNKRILRALRSQAVINIPLLYRQHKEALDQALSHRFAPNITSAGSTTSIALTALVLHPDRLLLQCSLQGHATLLVTGLK